YSSWMSAYATNGQSGFYADADRDGIANGLEFLLGGDPTVAGDSPVPTLATAAGGDVIYTFIRADRARGHAVVTVKLSDDLATWPAARDLAVGATTATSGPGVIVTDMGDHDSISIAL